MEGAHPPAGHALAPGVAIPVKREASTGAGTPTGRVLETWLPGLLEVLAEGFGRPSRNETLLLIARPEETLDSCRNKCSAHVCREAKRDEPDFGSVGRIGFRGRAGQAGCWAVGASSCNPIIYLFSWYKGFFPRASWVQRLEAFQLLLAGLQRTSLLAAVSPPFSDARGTAPKALGVGSAFT